MLFIPRYEPQLRMLVHKEHACRFPVWRKLARLGSFTARVAMPHTECRTCWKRLKETVQNDTSQISSSTQLSLQPEPSEQLVVIRIGLGIKRTRSVSEPQWKERTHKTLHHPEPATAATVSHTSSPILRNADSPFQIKSKHFIVHVSDQHWPQFPKKATLRCISSLTKVMLAFILGLILGHVFIESRKAVFGWWPFIIFSSHFCSRPLPFSHSSKSNPSLFHPHHAGGGRTPCLWKEPLSPLSLY